MAITLVGLQSGSWAGTTSSQTVSLSLSGGTASLPATDDLVLIGYATGSSTDRTLGITGYTLVGTELYSDEVNDTNLRVSYKFMGATPGALAIFSGTGNNADAGTWVIQVWRGVHTSSPLDAKDSPSRDGERVARAFANNPPAFAENLPLYIYPTTDLPFDMAIKVNDSNDDIVNVTWEWGDGSANGFNPTPPAQIAVWVNQTHTWSIPREPGAGDYYAGPLLVNITLDDGMGGVTRTQRRARTCTFLRMDFQRSACPHLRRLTPATQH